LEAAGLIRFYSFVFKEEKTTLLLLDTEHDLVLRHLSAVPVNSPKVRTCVRFAGQFVILLLFCQDLLPLACCSADLGVTQWLFLMFELRICCAYTVHQSTTKPQLSLDLKPTLFYKTVQLIKHADSINTVERSKEQHQMFMKKEGAL
jgi:hypothetical protein